MTESPDFDQKREIAQKLASQNDIQIESNRRIFVSKPTTRTLQIFNRKRPFSKLKLAKTTECKQGCRK